MKHLAKIGTKVSDAKSQCAVQGEVVDDIDAAECQVCLMSALLPVRATESAILNRMWRLLQC